jgi:hypothetical protein
MNSRAVLAFARDDPAAVIAAVAPVRDTRLAVDSRDEIATALTAAAGTEG